MKLNKVLSIVMVALMLVCVSTNVFAELNISTIMNSGALSNDAESTMGKVGGTIIEGITNVALIVAIVVLLVLGIKYMMGSSAEKAEYKKTMIPYLVGAVLVFGAAAIAKFVQSLGQSL